MSDLERKSVEVAAKATGLRPDQIQRAVEEYRAAVDKIGEEPVWKAIMHASGKGMGYAPIGPGRSISACSAFSRALKLADICADALVRLACQAV